VQGKATMEGHLDYRQHFIGIPRSLPSTPQLRAKLGERSLEYCEQHYVILADLAPCQSLESSDGSQ